MSNAEASIHVRKLPANLVRAVKARAAESGLTLKEAVEAALTTWVNEPEGAKTWQRKDPDAR